MRRKRRILYIHFMDYAGYPPLEHSSRILADRGWEVMLVGKETSWFQGMHFPTHPRILGKKFRSRKGGLFRYMCFSIWIIYLCLRWKPTWLYASDPFACPAAWFAYCLMRTQLLYHEHDSPDARWGDGWQINSVFAIRKKVAQNADICILPQQARVEAFIASTGRAHPIHCVWNCPRQEELFLERRQDSAVRSSDELVLYYHGIITRNRVPRTLIRAAKRFNGAVKVRLVGYEPPSDRGHISELFQIANNDRIPILEHFGIAPLRVELFRFAAQADVGISLMPMHSDNINMQHMVGASNKSFDYMASGLPLLVSDLPDWVSTFVTAGFGKACDPGNEDSIAETLRWYLDHTEERRKMGERGREKIRSTWNYDAMFAGVLSAMENAQLPPKINTTGGL